MFWNNLNNKKIGIWGMGLEGVSAQNAIKKHTQNTHLILANEDNLSDLNDCDIIIKSPGVSLYRPEIENFKKNGITITSGANLFFYNNKIPVIAVTGTKGKSTTTSLLSHTLKALGKNILLGGNIGVPLLDLTGQVADFIVAELSSYQCADLDGFVDIAVLNNLYPEHLQWHGSHHQYYHDKINLIRHAKTPVLNATDAQTKQLLPQTADTLYFNDIKGIHIKDGLFFDGETALFKTTELNLPGEHNASNACAVLTVIKQLGYSLTDCIPAFRSFQSLPHRLQTIGTVDGLTFVDDAISTTPETAVAGIKALDKGQDITLICGGMDRGQDYNTLIDFCRAMPERIHLITLPETGHTIHKLALTAGLDSHFVSDMGKAVTLAKDMTSFGGLVLLSPAAPSYNAYRNFQEKGDDFKNQALAVSVKTAL